MPNCTRRAPGAVVFPNTRPMRTRPMRAVVDSRRARRDLLETSHGVAMHKVKKAKQVTRRVKSEQNASAGSLGRG